MKRWRRAKCKLACNLRSTPHLQSAKPISYPHVFVRQKNTNFCASVPLREAEHASLAGNKLSRFIVTINSLLRTLYPELNYALRITNSQC